MPSRCRLFGSHIVYGRRGYSVKFVSSREIRINPRAVFDHLEEGNEVVINAHGKPVALMLGVDEENLEETLRAVRTAKVQAAVSRMRRIAAEKGSDELNRAALEVEIGAVRRGHV